MFVRGLMAGILALLAVSALGVERSTPPPITKNPKCDLPFPHDALLNAPGGFNGTALVLISFNVKGEFRSGRLLRSSGNQELDDAALHAAVQAKCEPLGDINNPDLQQSLIGIPFAYTFDNSRGSGPAQALPIR